MDNPTFIDEEETIPLAQGEDYDNYIIPDTSKVDDVDNINRQH